MGALAAGLALDSWLDTRPLFTLLLVLASIPLSLYLLVRIALSAAAQVAPPTIKQTDEQSPAEEDSPTNESPELKE